MNTQRVVSPEADPNRYVRSMDLRVLGPLEAVEDGQLLPLGGMKQRTVLALLIAHGGKPVSTDALIDGVYGEDAPSGARRSVQTYVSNLRSQLGDVIRSMGSGYILDPEVVTVDADLFESLAGENGDGDPDETAERLGGALAMWRGHPYADVDGFGAIPSEVSRLNELRLIAVERRVEAFIAAGRHSEIVGELESLTTEYPFRESFRAQQMLALYRSGRQAEALRAFEKARVYLVEEMGLDPSPELRSLESRILEQDPTLGYEPSPTIRRAAVLVADMANPASLAETDPGDRVRIVDEHADAVSAAVDAHGGVAFAQRGTATYAWFESVSGAVKAAEEAQWSLADIDDDRLRTRMAIDLGDVERMGTEGVQGPPVSRAASLLACARGGHVLLSPAAHAELTAGGGTWQIRGLGTAAIDGVEGDVPVHLLHGGWPMAEASLSANAIAPAPPDRSQSIPGYEWREKVGEGLFGIVHRAYQPSVGREVAIKRIRPELADHPSFIRRFEVEAQLVARLEHPHIVPLYDFWRDADGAFLVMRWMRGGNLAQRLRRGFLGDHEAALLLSQIGPALAMGHRRGVVHRDIRPENVLADDEGNWYLTDFGVALIDAPVNGTARDVVDLGKLLVSSIGSADGPIAAVALDAADGRYADVDGLLAAVSDASGRSLSVDAVARTDARNPYKSLDAFTELDADDFFGRDELIGQLVGAVGQQKMTAVVGPSGIGKSSVVRAGLIPAIRNGAITGSESWLVTDMVPTAYPFEQLASALERVGTRTPADLEARLRGDSRGLLKATQRYLPPGTPMMLVVDQFEELFTLVSDEAERLAFLDLLTETATDAHSSVRLVLTIRADFFDRPLRYASFGKLLRSGTINASAPTDDELGEIIARPAAAVGVSYEPGLVDRIITDVGNQPGTLPLLEFALTRLFEHRAGDAISGGDYDRIGGVLAALGRRAEQVFGQFDDAQRDVTRQLFLRLVNVGESARSTRRRTRLTELNHLGYSPAELSAVVDPLVNARLVTVDRDPITRGPTLEVAHEALLAEWSRLAKWIEGQQEDLLLHSRLAAAVSDWETTDRSEKYLLRAGRLEQHEDWTASTELSLTTPEREFLELSREAENERRAHRRRSRRRVLMGFGAAALVASVLAAAALIARRDAQHRSMETRARELAASSILAIDDDPELGLMLAITSAETAEPQPTTANALHNALQAHRTIFARTLPAEDSPLDAAVGVMSPDGTTVAVGGLASSFEVWSIRDGSKPLWEGEAGHPDMSIVPMGFTADGKTLIAEVFSLAEANLLDEAPAASGVAHFDVATGERTLFVEYQSLCALDGRFLHMSAIDLSMPIPMVDPGSGGECNLDAQADVVLLDLLTGDQSVLASGPVIGGPAEDLVSMTPDGRVVAVGGGVGRVFDVATGEELLAYPGGLGVLNETGTLVLGGYETISVWDVTSSEPLVASEPLTTFGREGEFTRAGFMNDDATVWAVSRDGSMKFFEVETGTITLELTGHTGRILEAGVSRDESAFFSTGADSTVRVWTLADRIPEVETDVGSQLTPLASTHRGALVSGDRAVLARGGLLGQQIVVVDVESGAAVAEMSSESLFAMTLSPDNSTIAFQASLPPGDELPEGIDQADRLFAHVGAVGIYDLNTGELVREMEGLCSFYMSEATHVVPPECGKSERDEMPAAVYHLSFSGDGTYLAMDTWFRGDSDQDGDTVVWETATGRIVFDRIGDPTAAAGDPVFSPDGTRLVLGTREDGFSASVWDTNTWVEVARIPLDQPWHDSFFTPDGSMLAFADWGGQIVLIDTETWEVSGDPLDAHDGLIRSMDMTGDGTRLVTAANDGLIRVWDVQTRALLQQFDFGSEDFAAARFFDDDRLLLVTPMETGIPLVMNLDVDDLLESARTRVTRGFTPEECASYKLDPCPTLEEIRAGV